MNKIKIISAIHFSVAATLFWILFAIYFGTLDEFFWPSAFVAIFTTICVSIYLTPKFINYSKKPSTIISGSIAGSAVTISSAILTSVIVSFGAALYGLSSTSTTIGLFFMEVVLVFLSGLLMFIIYMIPSLFFGAVAGIFLFRRIQTLEQ